MIVIRLGDLLRSGVKEPFRHAQFGLLDEGERELGKEELDLSLPSSVLIAYDMQRLVTDETPLSVPRRTKAETVEELVHQTRWSQARTGPPECLDYLALTEENAEKVVAEFPLLAWSAFYPASKPPVQSEDFFKFVLAGQYSRLKKLYGKGTREEEDFILDQLAKHTMPERSGLSFLVDYVTRFSLPLEETEEDATVLGSATEAEGFVFGKVTNKSPPFEPQTILRLVGNKESRHKAALFAVLTQGRIAQPPKKPAFFDAWLRLYLFGPAVPL